MFQKREENPMWEGDGVGYGALHAWIARNKTKPRLCESCKKASPCDLANISGDYKRDINDFEWLCRKCHMTKDGRVRNLKRGGFDGKTFSEETITELRKIVRTRKRDSKGRFI